MSQDDRSAIRRLLEDFIDLLELMLALLGDDEAARESFGMTTDTSAIAAADGVIDTLRQLAAGEAGLMELGDAARRVTEVKQLVELAAQAGEAGETFDLAELAGFVLDGVTLTYAQERWPRLVSSLRLLALVDDQIHLDRVYAFLAEDALGYLEAQFAPLDDEAGAQRQSFLLALLASVAALLMLKSRPPGQFALSGGEGDVEVLHGWEPEPNSDRPLADQLSERMLSFALRFQRTVEVALIFTLALVPRDQGGPGLWVSLSGEAALEQPIGGGWHIVAEGALEDGVDCLLAGQGSFVDVGGAIGGEIELRVERRDEPAAGVPEAPWRFGPLEVKEASFALRLADTGPVALVRLRDCAFVLEPPEDEMWRRAFPSGMRADFDLGVGVDRDGKVFFESGSGLRVLVPFSLRLPLVTIEHLTLRLGPGEGEPKRLHLDITVAPTLRLFGIATLTADGIGTRLSFLTGDDVSDRFRPNALLPTAAGLAIDAGPVKGGGFVAYDEARERWAGVLELTLWKLSLKAFGLITKRPGGHSVIVVLSLEFPKPIPLWLGFRLHAIGGLIACGHRLDPAVLQAGVRSGIVGTLLFPKDPVAAGPRIIEALGAAFPVAAGQHVVGPMVKLTWLAGSVITLSLAVLFEGPEPRRVILLGTLEIALPSAAAPVFLLRADAVGLIDLEGGKVEIDATLRDSRLGRFPLNGDAALRLATGDDTAFVITAGGFHPRFEIPPEMKLPPLRRLSLALAQGDNPRATLELYFAVTAATVQIGGKLDVFASAGGFSAEALLSIDSLIARDPFGLDVDLVGRAALRYDGSTIAGVELRLNVTGPAPWRVDGKAKLDLFLFSVSVPIRGTFGDAAPEEAPARLDAAELLRAALADESAWETGAPVDAPPLVTVGPAALLDDAAVAHPLGRLTARQHVLPLGVDLVRVAGARTTPDRFDVTRVTIAAAAATPSELRSPFAPGQFVDLSEDEQLSRPEFERLVAGFEVAGETSAHGPALAADLAYEEIVLGPEGPVADPRPGRPALGRVLAFGATLGAASRSELRRDDVPGRLRATAPRVELVRPARVLADPDTLRPAESAPSVTEALARRAGRPLVVVDSHEAAAVG